MSRPKQDVYFVRKLKLWVKGFFGFSRAETNAFLILIPLMLLLIFSEPVYRFWFVRQPNNYSKEKHQLDSIIASMEWPNDSVSSGVEMKSHELFAFNPNLSTRDDFIRLGFQQAVANRIINYRAKGGRFIIKNDLGKIYGMDSIFFMKLHAYIQLPENIIKIKPTTKSHEREKPVITKFDLNTADTSQLIKIYGIGPKLAKRIVTYRSKLGGFILANQLKEIYGLDSTVVNNLLSKSFISEDFRPEQININTAPERELAAHPYIKYKLAKAIIAYRMQHGAFNSLDDLKKITIISDSDFQKIKPYMINQ